ncbi:hypothetical protein BCR44DRAFT_395646 [Catenaria anguillulae PL171]|uniref:Uncharacterized protein n=1 Tax=Catenaria anguillulae PL171 TaxID=765915 RepID=A0A1Y2HIA8_9FUNG|nr:hypothetical protein BCR44DRAFT_395646 [Catenaria anguillulae PL171]
MALQIREAPLFIAPGQFRPKALLAIKTSVFFILPPSAPYWVIAWQAVTMTMTRTLERPFRCAVSSGKAAMGMAVGVGVQRAGSTPQQQGSASQTCPRPCCLLSSVKTATGTSTS